jgi:hypothetical protein
MKHTLAYMTLVLAIGAGRAAAGGITAEKEEDTWTSLTTTDLTGEEIVVAKMAGAAWGPRLLPAALMATWILGVVAGALHPLGLLLGLAELAVFTWFHAALGLYVSLHARTTTRAMALTIAVVLFANGGYLFCCLPLQPDTPAVAFGCTPAVLACSLVTWWEVNDLVSLLSPAPWSSSRLPELIGLVALGTLAYAVAAAGLSLASLIGFDAAIDRPSRDEPPRSIDDDPLRDGPPRSIDDDLV